MLQGEHAQSLWAFSLAFYSVESVSPLLIEWQDRNGIDVNVVLSLSWHAGRGLQLNEPALDALIRAGEPWRAHVIAPVRNARRAIKTIAGLDAMPDAMALRERLLTLELDLERAAQERLQAASDVWLPPQAAVPSVDPPGALQAMLRDYARCLGTQLPTPQCVQLAQRLQAFVVSHGVADDPEP